MITSLPTPNEREIKAALGSIDQYPLPDDRALVFVRLVNKGYSKIVAGRAALTPAFGFTRPVVRRRGAP